MFSADCLAQIIKANSCFDTSTSGVPGFNFAGGADVSQSAAASAGDYFSFDLQPDSQTVTCEQFSLFSNQFDPGANGRVDVSYRIGAASEVFVLQGFTPVGDNGNVAQQTVDFPDFSSDTNVTWTFYLYGAIDNGYGTRFDDITLGGAVGSGGLTRL